MCQGPLRGRRHIEKREDPGDEVAVNALNDVTDGVTDHVAVVITCELVDDALVTSLMTLV